MKTLTAVVLFLISTGTGIAPAIAQNSSAQVKGEKAVSAKKRASGKANENAPDISRMEATDFKCELGNTLTIFSEAGNDQHIALRWKKRVHRMTRKSTSTGAHRFEDPQVGLVWIGIPAKGMLLDAKKGRQLANECKSTAQRNVAEQRF